MKLEIGTVPVEDVSFGSQTRYRDGLLEIDSDELLDRARRDPRVTGVRLELAHPGESARIVNVQDVIEPRLKVAGPGVAYPGVCGRSTETVGQGRTLRLGSLGVTLCADLLPYKSAPFTIFRGSVDMSGPGTHEPYSALHHVCLTFETDEQLDYPERNEAAWRATFAVSERLAQLLADQEPAAVETFELAPSEPRLPRMLLLTNIHSVEHHSGTVHGFGEAVYGLSRLHPPWLLHPNEILDGCIAKRNTWINANDPLAKALIRAHNREFNVLGVLVQRTRWSYQSEKDLTAHQMAKIARMLGADGVIVASDAGGNDFVEVALTVRACIRAGLATVLMSTEESSEEGAKPPWLFTIPEADAVVSLGSGGSAFGRGERTSHPPMERAIGGPVLYTDGNALDGAPVPATAAVPGGGSTGGRWGWGTLSCFDY
jgi:glycine reductase